MRLLKLENDGTLSLTPDLHDRIPPYAILSHTWGNDEDEVTFDGVSNARGRGKPGFAKILFCGQQAKKDGLEYFWVDTCCINKADLTELSTAINTMFQWYQDARKCYVYLADVSSHKRDAAGQTRTAWESSFRASRWFTRGWTLQELLAPAVVEFYSREEQFLGNKATLGTLVEEITGIGLDVLEREAPLSSLSVPARMRWAERRNTTRVEDRFYCLLGIFDVSMSLRYGEGEQAHVRLKNKIAKRYRSQLDEIEMSSPSLGAPVSNDGLHGTQSPSMDLISVDEKRSEWLALLGFEQMESRRNTIKTAFSSTCAWFLNHPAYLNWTDLDQLEQHHGFLWISGKPGAGKSTLIKFLHASAERTKTDGDILLCFFFNARGGELEKSTIGMYRALLFQLLNQATDLQEVFDDFRPAHASQSQEIEWDIDSLHKLLLAALQKLGQRRLMCFIDALDECDEEQVRDMVAFFEDLGEITLDHNNRLYICFASRHYPTIETEHGLQVMLEHEPGHNEDLKRYVQRHLRIGKGKYADDVRTQVLEKANGVFMWIVLVMDILNDVFRRGRIFAVQERLREIPQKLSDLFRDILKRDVSNLPDLLLCIQWILFAKTPLTRDEFYFAMVAGLAPGSDEITAWDPERVTPDHMRRFVLNSSKGLAELSKGNIVQFIHESVRDFLIKDGGLCELWPELSRDLESFSHDELKRCCLNYLIVQISPEDILEGDRCVVLPPEEDPPLVQSCAMPIVRTGVLSKDFRLRLCKRFPFLKYSIKHVMYHANHAAKSVPQEQFLQGPDLARWIFFSNLMEPSPVNRYGPKVKPPYLFAQHNCAGLLQSLGTNDLWDCSEGARWRYPLFAALAEGHRDVVRVLLQQYTQGPVDNALSTIVFNKKFRSTYSTSICPLTWAIQQGQESLAEVLALHRDTHFDQPGGLDQQVIIMAARKGQERVVDLLMTKSGLAPTSCLAALFQAIENDHVGTALVLIKNGVETNGRDVLGDTPLVCAAHKGQEAVVQLLLGHHADPNLHDSAGSSAVTYATLGGHENIVRIILEHSGNVARSEGAGRALVHAVNGGRVSTVRLLLHYGTDPNVGWVFTSALMSAVRIGHEAMTQLLLDHGAGTECVDSIHRKTPLLLAVSTNQDGMVRRLLNSNANTEAKDPMGRTALSYAAYFNKEAIVQQLIQHGADLEARDNDGRTPLAWAAELSLQCLLDHGADIESRDDKGRTSLILAACYGHETIVERLLDNDAQIEGRDHQGYTALMSAISRGKLETVQLLLRYKAELEAKDNQGQTALLLAASFGFDEIVRILLDQGADIEAIDNSHFTALLWAASEGHEPTVRDLLNAWANIEATDRTGRTALSWAAAFHGTDEIVRLLLSRGANIHVKDLTGKTALQWAIESRIESTARILQCKANSEGEIPDTT